MNAVLEAEAPAGWYGKLPSLGDFASRRLDTDWVTRWDGWLAQGLQALRVQAPDTWLAGYLATPAWRFALLPGTLAPDDGLRVGVLLPSVDRVGRYFPLALVSAATPQPRDAASLGALWHWVGQLESLALTALHDCWSPEALEDALQTLGPPPSPPEPDHDATLPHHDLHRLTHPEPTDLPEGLTAVCAQAAWVGLQGHSLWFSSGTAQPWLPWVVRGLPSGSGFAGLFSLGRG